jgi:hypothetical protein
MSSLFDSLKEGFKKAATAANQAANELQEKLTGTGAQHDVPSQLQQPPDEVAGLVEAATAPGLIAPEWQVGIPRPAPASLMNLGRRAPRLAGPRASPMAQVDGLLAHEQGPASLRGLQRSTTLSGALRRDRPAGPVLPSPHPASSARQCSYTTTARNVLWQGENTSSTCASPLCPLEPQLNLQLCDIINGPNGSHAGIRVSPMHAAAGVAP